MQWSWSERLWNVFLTDCIHCHNRLHLKKVKDSAALRKCAFPNGSNSRFCKQDPIKTYSVCRSVSWWKSVEGHNHTSSDKPIQMHKIIQSLVSKLKIYTAVKFFKEPTIFLIYKARLIRQTSYKREEKQRRTHFFHSETLRKAHPGQRKHHK